MATTGLRLRAEWRASWPALVAVTLLFALAGGAALATAAGAVRTFTVGERLLDATGQRDLLVLPETAAPLDAVTRKRLAEVPGVVSVVEQAGAACFPAGMQGFDATCRYTVGSDAKPELAIRSGRPMREGAAGEIMLNEAAAEQNDWKVGDRVKFRFAPNISYRTFATGEGIPAGVDPDVYFEQLMAGKVGVERTLEVVGVGITTYAARNDYPTIYLTPAIRDELGLQPVYWGFSLDLQQDDRDAAQVQQAVNAMAPGEQINYGRTATITETIAHRVQPEAIAVASAALILAGAGLGLWLQTASRQARLAADEDRILGALGSPPIDRLRAELVRAGLVATAAMVIAVPLAWSVSDSFPNGAGRTLEPDPGRQFDAAILLGAAALLVLAVLAISTLVHVRTAVVAQRTPRGSTLARRIRRLPLPPTAATGLAYALESRADSQSAPARSTLLGAVGGVGLAVGVITFSAGVTHFINTPATYGWPEELNISISRDVAPDALKMIEQRPTVREWARGRVLQGFVAGRPESLMGVGDGTAQIGGTMLAGRRPRSESEVALGARTLTAAGAEIGDFIELGAKDRQRKFRVVGTVVLPGLHTNDSDPAALGTGALLTLDGVVAATGSEDAEGTVGAECGDCALDLFIDLEGESTTDFLKALDAAVDDPIGDALYASGPDAPHKDALPDVLPSYRASRTTLLALAVGLSALALGGVGLALVVSVRRRRRELATLAALGTTRRQLLAIISWQSTAVALIAGVVGTGVGVVLGRVLWLAVARQIGIQPVAPVPWLAVAVAVPATVIALNIAGLAAAWQASRISPAEALRSE